MGKNHARLALSIVLDNDFSRSIIIMVLFDIINLLCFSS